MSRDMQINRQMGPAMGVDESVNPRGGTVAEAFNLDTSAKTWLVRWGFNPFTLDETFDTPTRVLAEYIPDPRYESSLYHALIIGGGSLGAFSEYIGGKTCNPPGTLGTSSKMTGHGQKGGRNYTWAQGLWSYKVGEETKYSTAMLFTNGEDPPCIYEQSSGAGAMSPLLSYNPQDGVSYLPAPPAGKFVFVYKSRFFMGNISGESGNRLYWTGPDSAQAFPMTIWPASYNLDVGESEDLTAGIVFGDSALVFKENDVYLLNGEGVGGAWSIQKISSAGEGAIGPRAVCHIGNAIVFYNSLGVYAWSGRSIRNISHPRLEKTWAKLDWGLPAQLIGTIAGDPNNDKVFQALHDQRAKRVFLSVSTHTTRNDMMLIWNYEHDSWDIWGSYWENLFGNVSSAALRFLSFGAEVNQLVDGPAVVFPSEATKLCIYTKHRPLASGQANQGIRWKLKTHPMVEGDEYSLVRKLSISMKKTGSYYLVGLLLRDGDDLAAALTRGSEKFNFINDKVSAFTHSVVGTSQFRAATDGPVDIWYIPQLALVAWDRNIATAGAGNIVFTETFDTNNANPGNYLVVPAGTAPVLVNWMADTDQPLWDTATWANTIASPIAFKRVEIPTNCKGRKVSLYLSNVGYTNGTISFSAPGASVIGMGGEIEGWEMWTIPTTTRR